MPVEEVTDFPAAPGRIANVTDFPEDRGNIIEAAGNGLAGLVNSGIPGSGEPTPEQGASIQRFAKGAEDVLGNALDSVLPTPRPGYMPGAMQSPPTSSADVLAAGGGMIRPPDATGNQIAEGLLSRKTARAVGEGAAGFAATLPIGGEGAIPAVARVLASGIGAAAGSLGAESFDPTQNPKRSAVFAALTQLAGQGIGEIGLGAARGMKAEDLATSSVSNFADNYLKAATKGESGELLSAAMEGSKDVRDAIVGANLRAIDKKLGGPIVDASPIKQFAADQLAKVQRLPGKGLEGTKAFLRDVLDQPDTLTFEHARDLRSYFLSHQPDATQTSGKYSVETLGKKLEGTLDDQMETAAKSVGNDNVYKLWRATNELHKEGAQIFAGPIGRAIATKQPEVYFKTAIEGNTATGIGQLRKVMNDPAAWEHIQGQTLKDITDKATDEAGRVDGTKLLRAVKPGGTFGDENFSAVFSPQELLNFRKSAGALSKAQNKPGIAVTTGATGAMVLGHPYVALGILFERSRLSSLLTNRTFASALSRAAEIPLSSPRSVEAFGQLAALAARYSQHSTRHDSAQSIPPSELAPP